MLGKKIGVVGVGMMGTEIALGFALKGYDVIISDLNMDLAKKAKDKMVPAMDRLIKRKALEADDKKKADILALVKVTDKLKDYADRDLIIEAVTENVETKLKIFAELDKICQPSTIIASNTSSISITTLGSATSPERQKRFLGLHYFSPATIMKLVEVIPGFVCEDAIVETCIEYVKAVDHVPVKVKDVAGFAVNRILHALIKEALRLVEEGVATPADIDTACKLGLNHPMGPFELCDNVSVELTYLVQEVLFADYGERFRPDTLLRKMITSGHIGRKVGRGFFDWTKK